MSEEEKRTGEEYVLCDLCGRNLKRKEMAGDCCEPGCERVICKEVCSRICSICNKVFCKDHAYQDPETNIIYCEAHVPREKCEICEQECIAKTLIKGDKEIEKEILGNCKECEKLVCKKCGHLCAECGEVICKDHEHYDANTGKYYCKDHLPGVGAGSAGGCFIATAAYGTPFEPKIDVLRDFRDDVLMEHRSGKDIIKLYYTLSPPIAYIISKHRWMRSIVREIMVEPLVRILSKDRYK